MVHERSINIYNSIQFVFKNNQYFNKNFNKINQMGILYKIFTDILTLNLL